MDENRGEILQNMQICRFCLNSERDLSNIYDTTKNKKLPLQLMACVALEVYQNDGMPRLICDECRILTLQAYSFRLNCKKADDSLKLFLATGTLTTPFTKNDFKFYKTRRNVDSQKPIAKKPKLEIEHSDDSQTTPSVIQVEQPQQVTTYEEKQTKSAEFNLKILNSSTSKNEVKIVKTDSFQCTECDKAFPLKQLLEIHMKNHVSEFFCNYCDQSFTDKNELMLHSKRKHNKRKPFTCNDCGKSFVFKQGLERHIAIHNENKPHKCNYCEASFSSQIKLTRHITSHAGLRPYPCKLCKRTFLLSHHLTRHMRSHYAAISNNAQQIGQHKCDSCSMSFKRKDSLINHSAIHSMVNLKCVICNTEFENAQAVKEHITTHLSGLPFPCDKCDYSFETTEQLEEHEVKHAEMEYEEQIEKEVVEEAKAQGHLLTEESGEFYDDDEEFGGDHMGRTNEDDDDYEDDGTGGASEVFSITDKNEVVLRRSKRTLKPTNFTDFLKEQLGSDEEEEDEAEAPEQETPQQTEIKPIVRSEGTKVYKRKATSTPSVKSKIDTSIKEKPKTAPLSQINQPQVTTIENLGLTTKDLDELPTEKYVDMKIGNKTVRVQKLVLTKEEMKAMAKQGKIRGNTVLIKNPGQITSKVGEKSKIQKTYNKKKTEDSTSMQTSNVAIVDDQKSVIINGVLMDAS